MVCWDYFRLPQGMKIIQAGENYIIDEAIKIKIGYNMKNRVGWRWNVEKSIASWSGKFKEKLTQKEYEQYIRIADKEADEKQVRGSLKLFSRYIKSQVRILSF